MFVSHRVKPVSGDSDERPSTWQTAYEPLNDGQWALIEDLVQAYSVTGKMGRPPKWRRRDVVDAILYVAATGCQWRLLPEGFPHWNTVHRYHVTWSRDGTWEAVVDRLRALERERQGRDPEPSAGIVDARSVQGAATVTGETRGYDAGKKVSGRKTFGVVDTIGLLMAVVVVAASASDNAGGTAVMELAAPKSGRLATVWHDAGFKRVFAEFCRSHKVKAELVSRRNAHTFEVLPRRWVVERTWGWLVHHRRLRIDYERDPAVTAGFVWAAQAHILLRRLA